jgi:hypothetical protein
VRVEGQSYRVSIAAAERRRLERFRQATARPPLDALFALDAIADTLSSKAVTLAEVQDAARRLKVVSPPAPPKTMPPGVDVPRPASQIIAEAVKTLTRIGKPKDLKKAAGAADDLAPVIDAWLGDELRALVYAVNLGDPDEQFGADVSRRHDFGFVVLARDERERTPWSVPEQQVEAGAPFHLRGSLLAVDVATAPLLLKHVSSQQASRQPVLLEIDRATFVLTPALMNPLELRDDDRDAIAGAIARGRTRVQALSANGAAAVEAVRDAVGLDGWRYRAVLWSLAHGGDPAAFFSLVELLQLGDPHAIAALDAWGVAAWHSDTCLCTHTDIPNRWLLLAGRPQLGIIATQAADLPLRVAVALHDRALPAVLARDVLLAATADFVDEVSPTDSDDWLGMVRTAQRWPQSRIDDYIAALSAGGPLIPADAPEQAGR